MTKTIRLALPLAALCLAAAPAGAQDMFGGLSPYVRGAVGASFATSENSFKLDGGGGFGDLQDTYALSGAAGVAFGFGLRLEAEVAYRGDRDTRATGSLGGLGYSARSSIDLLTVMANAYYDIDFGSPFVPFIGGGVGWAQAKTDDLRVDVDQLGALSTERGRTESGFAWSLTAGVAYKASDAVAIELGYRYLDAGDAESGGSAVDAFGGALPGVPRTSQDLRLHEVSLGVRYKF